jgi:hypothetical protein
MEDEEWEPEDVAEGLRVVLAVHGIKLPSLGVDPVTGSGWYPQPLVALGNCNVATAGRLLAVLRNAAPPPSGAELRRRGDELNAAVRRHLGEEL